MNPLPYRRRIFGALAAIVLTAAPALAADPVFPLNSRIGLVPPPGFTPSTKFTGFENAAASAADGDRRAARRSLSRSWRRASPTRRSRRAA